MTAKKNIKVKLISFGFKYGAPGDCNYLFDVRFLPNPYWEEELRAKTGLENEVSDYVVGSGEGHDFLHLFKPMLMYIIQQNRLADNNELTLAIGCTGGRHRSVAMAEVVGDILRLIRVDLHIEHRDIDKDG